jgi:hypothetical protein
MEDHYSAPIVVPIKYPYVSRCSLSYIPKDAEFQELSESGFIFLGWNDLTILEAKY